MQSVCVCVSAQRTGTHTHKQNPKSKWKWRRRRRRRRPKSDEFNSMKIGLPNRLHSSILLWVRAAILRMLLHDKLYEIWEVWYDWVERMERKDRTNVDSLLLCIRNFCSWCHLSQFNLLRALRPHSHTHTHTTKSMDYRKSLLIFVRARIQIGIESHVSG